MTTLALAYSLAWGAVALYAVRLGVQHRQLARRVEALTKAPPHSAELRKRAA